MKKLLVAAALCAAAITPAAALAADPAPADSKNAAKYCKELKSASGASFASMFGTKKNAFGKCVSQTAKKTAADKLDEAQQNDRISAAESCKTAKKADAKAFGQTYGTKKNAFGKCVSTTARKLAAERKAAKEAAPTA